MADLDSPCCCLESRSRLHSEGERILFVHKIFSNIIGLQFSGSSAQPTIKYAAPEVPRAPNLQLFYTRLVQGGGRTPQPVDCRLENPPIRSRKECKQLPHDGVCTQYPCEPCRSFSKIFFGFDEGTGKKGQRGKKFPTNAAFL